MKNIWIFLDDLLNRSKAAPASGPVYNIQVTQAAPEEYDTRAEIERLQVLRDTYIQIDAAIDTELNALQKEGADPNVTTAREAAIHRRKLTLLNKRASTLQKLQAIERNIEKHYLKLHDSNNHEK